MVRAAALFRLLRLLPAQPKRYGFYLKRRQASATRNWTDLEHFNLMGAFEAPFRMRALGGLFSPAGVKPLRHPRAVIVAHLLCTSERDAHRYHSASVTTMPRTVGSKFGRFVSMCNIRARLKKSVGEGLNPSRRMICAVAQEVPWYKSCCSATGECIAALSSDWSSAPTSSTHKQGCGSHPHLAPSTHKS